MEETERERKRERKRRGVLRAGENEIWGGMNAKRVKISDEKGGGVKEKNIGRARGVK